MSSELETLKNENDKLRAELSEAKREIEFLSEARRLAHEAFEKMDEAANELLDERDAAREELAQAVSELFDLRMDLVHVEQELAAMTAERNDLAMRLQNAER